MDLTPLKQAFIATKAVEEFVTDGSAFTRGRLLASMKELCPHGGWTDLLKEIGVTTNEASRLINWNRLFVETSRTREISDQQPSPQLISGLQTSRTREISVEQVEAAVPSDEAKGLLATAEPEVQIKVIEKIVEDPNYQVTLKELRKLRKEHKQLKENQEQLKAALDQRTQRLNEAIQDRDDSTLMAKRQSEDVVRLVSDLKGLIEYIHAEGTSIDVSARNALTSLSTFINTIK